MSHHSKPQLIAVVPSEIQVGHAREHGVAIIKLDKWVFAFPPDVARDISTELRNKADELEREAGAMVTK